MGAASSAWAQSTWTSTNTNNTTNTNNNVTNAQSFGTNSFSFSSGNMNISQSGATGADSSGFCQFFSFSFGMMQIVQIIQGNSFSQVFGSASDPVEDPCL
ncbi:hypothetical protein Tel_08965 [Candidatus Tenderia electrophaga]|uniref:Uncharacterized protein n=1 Tax=Candidatus Tenderia electrophaga TaxID=1748243 RepID=A0A0S2TDP5_9GAMM|nr:hypothetical protein Tel_08965 [Candidatus Tenderia electrophaga]